MSWQEWLVMLAESFEGFQLGADIYCSVVIITNVKRYNADGVSGNEEFVLLLVIKHKGENAVDVLEEIDAFLLVEGKDNFAVALCLEIVLASIQASYLLMVVYLTIDSQYLLFVRRKKRLTATLWVNDTQSLMGKDSATTTIYTAPVRTTMTYLLTHLQSLLTQFLRLLFYIQYCCNSTHIFKK